MTITILDIHNEESKRNIFGKIEYWIQNIINPNKASGPESVKESLLRGLKILNISYIYNKISPDKFMDTVIVLSGINNLKQCINLKHLGYIKKLIAGPNLVTFSTDYNGIIGSSEIDLCLVPSLFVLQCYQTDLALLKNRIYIWPAGVNERFWNPHRFFSIKQKSQVTIYQKNAPKRILKEIIEYMNVANLNYEVVKYGNYNKNEYRKILSRSKCLIFLSQVESQGIALAEAWSMNVPTLVWKAKEVNIYGRKFIKPISAPYLTKRTGSYWEQGNKFQNIFDEFTNHIHLFNPRDWVLGNMTDKLIATNLINQIKLIKVGED